MLGYHLAQVVPAQSISQVTLAFDAHNATPGFCSSSYYEDPPHINEESSPNPRI